MTYFIMYFVYTITTIVLYRVFRRLIPFKPTWFVLRKTYQCRTAAVLSEHPLRCPRTRHFPVSRCLSNLILNWYPKSKGNIKHQCQIRFDAQYIHRAVGTPNADDDYIFYRNKRIIDGFYFYKPSYRAVRITAIYWRKFVKLNILLMAEGGWYLIKGQK